MVNKRTSILNDRDAVESAINSASSIKEVLNLLNLRAAGGNYRALHNACQRHNLTLPQYDYGAQLRGMRGSSLPLIPNSEVFVENSTYNNRKLIKNRMFALNIPNICSECGQEPWWNGKPLTLQLDHINGIWNDNRLENLRILRGHCHSQTKTFCGGNFRPAS